MKHFKNVLAIAALLASTIAVSAQTTSSVSRQINAVAPNAWLDLGNGPTVVVPLQGSALVYSSLASGTASTSGSSTTLTLTATAAAKAPCVGCVISGTGITAETTVAAFNGTTGITLSAAMTVTAATVSWGVACPTSGPPSTTFLSAAAEVRAGTNTPPAIPVYTSARVCAYGGGQGGTLTNFSIKGW